MTSPTYWLEETPVLVRTKHNVIRWYKQAGKLQICLPDYKASYGIRPGKTVSLHITEILENDEAKELIKEALNL